MLVELSKDTFIKNIITDENDIFKNGVIEIDDCLVDEIYYLWANGVYTRGCCCGHGKETGYIQVERTSFKTMLELGYKWYRDYPEEFGGKDRFDAFIPKSICKCNKEIREVK